MLQTQCPSCSRALSLPETMIGQQVRCPICNNVFQPAGETAPPPAAVQPPPSSRPAAPSPERRSDDEPPSGRSYPSSRRREYDDDEQRDAYAPRQADGRGSAAVWLLIAGILDVVVLLAFYVFLFTVDRRPPPPEAIMITTFLAVVFYIAPLVFVFIAAAVVRNPRLGGLVITGSVMTFILAVELLIMTGIFAIGVVVALTDRWARDRMPVLFVLMFLLSLAGLVISIVAGIKGLMAVSRSRPRRPDYY